jgi:histidinol-phosphate aminotransferase
MSVHHGGTDAGPLPRLDLSTNASPYGPSPIAHAAMQVHVGPYPDPAATTVRATLAEAIGVDPAEIVVGAGATELIDRLVRVLDGPVLVQDPSFGEYAGAANRHALPVLRATSTDALLAAMADAAVLFVASPGNPDGVIRDATFCAAVADRALATGTTVVWDLAYAPMVPEDVGVPDGAVQLHAPNKAHGCTGLRAGWLTAPAELAQRLHAAAVTWSVSTPGLALLAASVTPDAQRWAAARAVDARRDRDALIAGLRACGLTVTHGAAPFALFDLGSDAAAASFVQVVRARHGVKLRPTASQGLPGHVRIAAPTPDSLPLALHAIADSLAQPDSLAKRSSVRRSKAQLQSGHTRLDQEAKT